MKFYESPLFVDVLLYAIYLLIVVVTVLAVWSSVRSLLLERQEQKVDMQEEKK
jgi:hypothetical protein